MSTEKFIERHVGIGDSDEVLMLKKIGIESLDKLVEKALPDNIRLRKPIGLQDPISESDLSQLTERLAAKNLQFNTFIGMGYYATATPAVITRNILQNPSWYTSYTPYQAEISQGRLEALLNFQTVITSMTAMEIANSSLLDEGSATAEAAFMMYALRSAEAKKEGRNSIFVDQNIFPQTLDVLLTRCQMKGIQLIVGDFREYEFTGGEFGAIVQYPAADGEVRDYGEFTAMAHSAGVLVTAVADLMSLAILKAPGEWDADVVVGSTQRFGLPLGFGGPHVGYFATRERFKREMPGRIVGVSQDRLGNKALRMALQTREQHIKRERATSNICTASALMAVMSGFYAVYHGAEGITKIAKRIHSYAVIVAKALKELGYELRNDSFFDTIEVAVLETAVIEDIALEKEVNLYYPNESSVRFSIDELTTIEDVTLILEIFAQAAGKKTPKSVKIEQAVVPAELRRSTPFLTESLFYKYRTETELMRYIKMLERRDISLTHSMIPLGSCTMKLNSAVSMMPITLSGFANIHPFAPLWQADGYMEMIEELQQDLALITGMNATSLQPNSGASGEYAGVLVIRAYHESKGQGYRDVVLIPASAHGTNPATAAMLGLRIVGVATDDNGNVSVDDLRAKAEQYSNELCALMITYPSTHGIFEENIRDIIDIVHDNGGQVYMDGANLNALVGLSSPGYMGADVCHLNLHKSFAMPHGGGGPGVGPICVAEHIAPFLPSHPIVDGVGGDEGTTAVSSAPYGNALLLPITFGYIKMMGEEGLKRASQIAILSANYISKELESEYDTLYRGANGLVGHEMIVDLRQFKKQYGVGAADLARRLMDYGFHAPTLSFPVGETFMVEPTESESKPEVDRFVQAMKSIKRECVEIAQSGQLEDNIILNAPHTAHELVGEWRHKYSREQAVYPLDWIVENKFFPHVSKIDAATGDRNLRVNRVDYEE